MIETLKVALNKKGIILSNCQANCFSAFYKLLIETNKKVNLTRIVEPNDFANKHVLDSLSVLPYIPKDAKVIDVGAGGGFPSVPIKIMRPDIEIVMLDSVSKKTDFLNQTIKILGLKSAAAIHARVEDYAIENREKFDVVVSRAVAPLNTLLEYCAPLVKVGGIIIAYKGSSFEEEISKAKNAAKILGVYLAEKIEYQIQERNNYLLIYKKERRTLNLYPRRNNKPRKDPL